MKFEKNREAGIDRVPDIGSRLSLVHIIDNIFENTPERLVDRVKFFTLSGKKLHLIHSFD